MHAGVGCDRLDARLPTGHGIDHGHTIIGGTACDGHRVSDETRTHLDMDACAACIGGHVALALHSNCVDYSTRPHLQYTQSMRSVIHAILVPLSFPFSPH